jgi:hypothetical protein
VSADFDKFLKLEKRLFKLIDDPLSEGPTTSRKIMGKKERIRNKMRKLEPKIKGMKDGGLAEAIEKVKAKEMKEGGNVPKPKMRPKKDPFRADKTVIINEDFSKAVAKANEEAMKKAKKMEEGGPVPKKFKGFSKLPEAVQEKMNPTLAKKFEAGGPVKMGSGGGVCRGMGAARAGGKFKLR